MSTREFLTEGEARFGGAALSVSRQQFEDTTRLAAGLVAIWDGLGAIARALEVELPGDSEDISWARARAATPSSQESIKRIRNQIAETHLAAMGNANPDAVARRGRRYDGSTPPPPGAEGWEELEAQNFIVEKGYSQILQHQQMANAGPAPDPGDAHAHTRKIREQLYAKAEEEGRL